MTERDEQQIVAGLKSLAREMDGEQAPASLEARLRGAYRRKPKVAAWKRAAALSAIAASLAAVAVSMWPRRGPAPVEAPRLVVAPVVQPERVQPERVQPERVAPQQAVVRVRPKIRRARPAVMAPVREEIATGFLPVAGGDIFAPLDRGRVVRVRMPRSALAVFGLPVNEDRMADSVRADVLLGDDGMARAIRFVR